MVARDGQPPGRSPLKFTALVFGLSIPFLAADVVAGHLADRLPINLPASALMAVCPAAAAAILVRREGTPGGVGRLLRRALDHRKIANKLWYLPALLLMPGVALVSYAAMRLLRQPLPEPQIPLATVPAFAALFFAFAVTEELGWMGYAADPAQRRWGALGGAAVLGLLWGLWHTIPYLQAGNGSAWIAGQYLYSVALRVIIFWLYNNTSGSVFAAILAHTTSNLSWALFPNFGSHYNPVITGTVAAAATALIALLWGPGTLRRFRLPGLRLPS